MAVVAERMNVAIFNQAPVGSHCRLAGRCEFQPESQQWVLHSFEGANLPVTNAAGLEINGNQNLEIVGIKGPQGQLCASQLCKLPEGEMDRELWNSAVEMTHHPKLRGLFQPLQ